MIKVARTEKPPVLAKNESKWLSKYLVALYAYKSDSKNKKNEKAKDNAERKYNQPSVKEALRTMFSGKCAYCESQVLHIDYGDIEHFKPKSLFPNLCFSWDNFLLSCGRCNGIEWKGDKFPEAKNGGPFVNPVEENPTDFFDFEFDNNTGTANVIPKNQRGKTTETELGLNRSDLVKHRSSIVKKMLCVAKLAKEGNSEALEILQDCCQPNHEYSAFAKTIAKKFNLPI